jgi:hypothetical protein
MPDTWATLVVAAIAAAAVAIGLLVYETYQGEHHRTRRRAASGLVWSSVTFLSAFAIVYAFERWPDGTRGQIGQMATGILSAFLVIGLVARGLAPRISVDPHLHRISKDGVRYRVHYASKHRWLNLSHVNVHVWLRWKGLSEPAAVYIEIPVDDAVLPELPSRRRARELRRAFASPRLEPAKESGDVLKKLLSKYPIRDGTCHDLEFMELYKQKWTTKERKQKDCATVIATITAAHPLTGFQRTIVQYFHSGDVLVEDCAWMETRRRNLRGESNE